MYKKIIIPSLVLVSLFFIAFKSLSNNETKVVATEAVTPIEKDVLGDDYEPIIVLELFTSQGCSSCPPADVLLDKVKKQYPDKVYALSYHVDYWNQVLVN